jgi:hypothetical protein
LNFRAVLNGGVLLGVNFFVAAIFAVLVKVSNENYSTNITAVITFFSAYANYPAYWATLLYDWVIDRYFR